MAYRIACIPGDGIGIEVSEAAKDVLERSSESFGFELSWEHFDWGCERYLTDGEMMPHDAVEQLRHHDAIFFGAVGDPRVADHVSLWGLLIPLRRAFAQYVNLRPVRLHPGVKCPLRGRVPEQIDMVIVRENCEGEYSLIGGRHNVGSAAEQAFQTSVFSRVGVERIMHYAFRLAQSRTGRICSATKSNGILHTMTFWDEIFWEVAAEYPDVVCQQMHVDALAARMVLAPDLLDVIVASNLFGDILSDVGAAVSGSLGLAPSGNIHPGGEFPSMFESVHGSAPDIAGRGVANPIAQILAGAMMLDHLGEKLGGDAVRSAVDDVLAQGTVLPRDLGGSASTIDVAHVIADAIGG